MKECLEIPPALQAVIEAAADAVWPEEACGLLLGRPDRGLLLAAVPVPNRMPPPRRRTGFTIDPAFHAALARRARAQGLVICGAFHSHPAGPPGLSALDRRLLPPDPGWITLLLGSRNGRGQWRLAAFRGTRRVAIRRGGRRNQLFLRRSSSPVT
ncbi:MAG: hypothetical protein D6740_12295 [Alphaproteobacteria bacterium]|nr:MAG: hypothetical protein D6740_12295 [Alphaproteobacteria bacterium]